MLQTLFTKIGLAFAGLSATIAGFFGVTPQLGSTVPITPALFETSLSAPISTGDTSMTLAKGTLMDGSTLSGYSCFTIDSGQPNVEYVCGTASGTAVASLTRGINPLNGTSSVAALIYSHRRGANVKITDFPAISVIGRIINGYDTFPNTVAYATSVSVASVQANTQNFASVAYVNQVATSGAAYASDSIAGVTKLSVAPASSTNPISVGDNDTRVSPVSLATVTSGMVDALAGSSSTPSSSNKYLTQSDAATSSTANAIPRAGSNGKIDNGFISTSTISFSSLVSRINLHGDTISASTTIWSTSVLGGLITSSGVLRVTVPVKINSSAAGSAYFYLYFGNATTTLTITCPEGAGTDANAYGSIVFTVANNSSTTQQRVTAFGSLPPVLSGANTLLNAPYVTITQATTTADTASTQTLSLSAYATGCTANAYDTLIEVLK